MSYVSSIYHIIFSTQNRDKALFGEEACNELYRYIWGILKTNQCDLIRINSMPEHLHILFELNAQISLSELVRQIKRGSSMWIRQNGKFPYFTAWEREYAAFSVSYDNKEKVRQYIINQQQHHKKRSFEEELEKYSASTA